MDVTKGVAELEGFCNVMFHCFDHEIVLEGMKEEISQQRCAIGAHWYTNNLPENRASKTNVDMLSIRKSIARQSSLQEKYVYLMDILSFVQKVRKELVAMKLFPFV